MRRAAINVKALTVAEYLIERSIYYCYAGSQVVFLDLKRNKYSAIDRQQATVLNGVVAGWEAPDVDAEAIDGSIERNQVKTAVTKGLLELGILTKCPEHGKKAAPTQASRATGDLLVEYEPITPSIRLLHAYRLIKAYLQAVWSLRVSSLAKISDRIEVRKRKANPQPDRNSIADVREIFLVYVRLRPFLFRSNGKCLLDSLVLVEFLHHFNVYPTWVIGVSTDPFLAHSWLEIDGVVINDLAIRANHYVPILVQ